MTVIVLQVFVSLVLVAGSVVLFIHSVRQRDYEHADRLALAPLEDDSPAELPSTKGPPCTPNGSRTTTP